MDTLFVRSYGLFDPGPLLRLSHHRPPGGGEQLKVPVSHVLRRPTRPVFYGEHKRTADVGLRACATMQSHGFVSPPSHLFSSLSRTGKPRQFATGPFHFTGYYPGTSFPGHLFHRPRLGPPAVRATSLRRLALSTSLPHLRQVFYSSLLHEHEHRDRNPPFSTVQPPRRSLMQTCPHRRPLPAVGFARARPSGCVRPTWSRSTFSFLFFVWFVLFPDLNASLPLLFTGGYRSHPTKESFCARSSPRTVSGPRPLLLLNIMT